MVRDGQRPPIAMTSLPGVEEEALRSLDARTMTDAEGVTKFSVTQVLAPRPPMTTAPVTVPEATSLERRRCVRARSVGSFVPYSRPVSPAVSIIHLVV